MKKNHGTILSFITCVILAMALFCAAAAAAEEADPDFLGKPFPNFTVTDIDGTTFTLSESLKDHEAVLINFWATWCDPCRLEFPYLSEVYEQYRDRVAFIALSKDTNDTMEKIADFRAEVGIPFPMGSDAETKLYGYINGTAIPATVIVDRFGNTVFMQEGAFINAKEIMLLLDAFLGDGYTETAVQKEIPRDSSTLVFPVSAARALYPESSNYRKILLTCEGMDKSFTGYIIPDDSFRIRVELSANDDVTVMTYADLNAFRFMDVADLLVPEQNIYIYNQTMPGPSDELPYTKVALGDRSLETDPEQISLFLLKDEDAVRRLLADMKEAGYPEVTWIYAEEEEKPANALQAYVLHVVDQYNDPVGEVMVNFCTDTACVPSESDENGTVTFTGAPDVYHVQIIEVPDGYSWDEDYEMYTAREYGEWVLRVRKD